MARCSREEVVLGRRRRLQAEQRVGDDREQEMITQITIRLLVGEAHLEPDERSDGDERHRLQDHGVGVERCAPATWPGSSPSRRAVPITNAMARPVTATSVGAAQALEDRLQAVPIEEAPRHHILGRRQEGTLVLRSRLVGDEQPDADDRRRDGQRRQHEAHEARAERDAGASGRCTDSGATGSLSSPTPSSSDDLVEELGLADLARSASSAWRR